MHLKTSSMQSRHPWENITSASKEYTEEQRQSSPAEREIDYLGTRMTESNMGPLTSQMRDVNSGWENSNSENLSQSIWSAHREESNSYHSNYNIGPNMSDRAYQQLYTSNEQSFLSQRNEFSIHSGDSFHQSFDTGISHNHHNNNSFSAFRQYHNNRNYNGPRDSGTVTSTGSTIPGLAPAFSGSGSQYSQSNYSSSQNFQSQKENLGTMPSGPPPGFMSPSSRQTSTSTDCTTLTNYSEIASIESTGTNNRNRWINKKRINSPLLNCSVQSIETTETTESEALKLLMKPQTSDSLDLTNPSLSMASSKTPLMSGVERPILPKHPPQWESTTARVDSEDEEGGNPRVKKHDWLMRMNRRLNEITVGDLDPSTTPLSAIMNAWAKTKSSQGASMVEMWLNRAQQEFDAGNPKVVPTTKMYTMAVDAWAKSGEGGAAATRAEAILQHMNSLHQKGGHENLKPTTGIFNAVINAWARSREKIAPVRAEQILDWMDKLHKNGDVDIQPDKYTFNTVIHAWAKSGGKEAAGKAQKLLDNMHRMHKVGNLLAKPDTITYNVVINAWAKSGGKGSAREAEKLLAKMHDLHRNGDLDIKPNVVTYGAVIDAHAKSGEKGAAARADALLADMIQQHQRDPVMNGELRPNTYVFNTVINCWAKSKERDAASKAEEMLVAMGKLHASGIPNLKPDAFTYTAVIDAWAKSGYRGAAARADQLLDKMEAKYQAGDVDLKPNTFTYNAVINALAKSGEPGAAARAERVLQNMVNRHRNGNDEVKPTTINFNTVLDAWAKSGGGRAAAERAEEILEWMDRLNKNGNNEVKPDTITFNAVLDAWARSGDRIAPRRAEQILNHMDELFKAGNKGVKPDTYTYNTLINAWAKSGERGAASRAEHVLSIMEKRYKDGDNDFKPNTRTHTSVIDAWAKSGEQGAAQRAEQILKTMQNLYQKTGDPDVKPNVHTANAVCNACAFTKIDGDRGDALAIAFRVFEWIKTQNDMQADAYTYTILLSVCANLLPRDDRATRFLHARNFFESCCKAGYVNDYVLRKLRQTVVEDEYLTLIDCHNDASSLPKSWTRNARLNSAKRYNNRGGNRGRRRK